MTAAAVLVALYPPGVRDRWGSELRTQVAESGMRGWPDTVAGAIRLWLRPSDWPENVAGQTRRVVATMLFGLMAASALVLRAVEPTPAVTADPTRPATSLWLVPLVAGLGLAAPWPPLRWVMLRRVALDALRVLAAPTAAVAAMFAVAYSGLVDHPAGWLHIGVIGYYWATLGFVASRMCALVARVGRLAAAASLTRLRAALFLAGCGAGLGAGQGLASLPAVPAGSTMAMVVALGVLASVSVWAACDLGNARDRST
jgi:hypothetical protein